MLRFFLDNSRWLATGIILAFGSAFGQTWFISLSAGEIRAEFGLSDGEWGGIYTIATLASALLLLSRGSLADTMPLSRLAPLVASVFALAALGMAFGQSIWILGLSVFFLRFCGQGMFTHIAATAMGRWFVANRGRAIAIKGLGFPLGEMVWPLVFVLLIATIGWRSSWMIVAGIIALGLLPALMVLLSQDRAPQGQGGEAGSTGLEGRHWTRSEVLSHWLFPALTPLMLTPGFIGTVVFFHQVHIAEVKGWSLTQMAVAYPVYASVTIVVSILTGWACDRFGSQKLLPIVLVPMGLAMFLIGPAAASIMWVVALAVMALTQGMVGTLWGAFLPFVYGTKNLGAVRSMNVALMVLSTAIGPGVTGWLIDLGITFPEQCFALGLWCLGLALAMVFVLRKLGPEIDLSQRLARP